MKIKRLEKSVNHAIKNLRISKLNKGIPFMINSDSLSSNQCYLEYPDGSIVLVSLSRKANDFKVINKLSSDENRLLREKYKLI